MSGQVEFYHPSNIICVIVFLQEFEKVMTRRHQQYYQFRLSMALRARYAFIVMLGNRNYTGKLDFDHKGETLNMVVGLHLVYFTVINQISISPEHFS